MARRAGRTRRRTRSRSAAARTPTGRRRGCCLRRRCSAAAAGCGPGHRRRPPPRPPPGLSRRRATAYARSRLLALALADLPGLERQLGREPLEFRGVLRRLHAVLEQLQPFDPALEIAALGVERAQLWILRQGLRRCRPERQDRG